MSYDTNVPFHKYTARYKNKYSNKTCRCHLGHNHDSCMEAGYCDQLSMLKTMKEIRDFKTQVSYSFDINGAHICNHIVDFLVEDKDGHLEVHEVKGFANEVWRIKFKLFEALYPEIPYRIIR